MQPAPTAAPARHIHLTVRTVPTHELGDGPNLDRQADIGWARQAQHGAAKRFAIKLKPVRRLWRGVGEHGLIHQVELLTSLDGNDIAGLQHESRFRDFDAVHLKVTVDDSLARLW